MSDYRNNIYYIESLFSMSDYRVVRLERFHCIHLTIHIEVTIMYCMSMEAMQGYSGVSEHAVYIAAHKTNSC